LPFGAPNHIDNFSTIMLTIGSPTLAIFSLMITTLNSRRIKARFERIAYPNSNQAVIILDNLQESLLRVNKTSLDGQIPLLASKIVLPQNDQWWQRGAATLAFTHTWSMVNIASVGWAVIAYIFTILYLFIQFVGHASQRGLTATNFGCCHASPRRLTNTIFVTVCPKSGSKTNPQKSPRGFRSWKLSPETYFRQIFFAEDNFQPKFEPIKAQNLHKWRYQRVWSAQVQGSAKMVRNRFLRSLYHLKTI
jgi:hypothetical protein